MKQEFPIPSGGRNERAGDLLINRLLPNEQILKIGPVVFLAHVYPTLSPAPPRPGCRPAKNVYPRRGIVTLNYLLNGCLEHHDSRGHRGMANPGDLLWMKAGSGIIREEAPACPETPLHAVQFWIILPAVNKGEDPEFRVLASDEIPELALPDDAGVLRVLLGSCGICESPLRQFFGEFIYHVRLNPKSAFTYAPRGDLECGIFIPSDEIRVNGSVTGRSHLLTWLKRAPVFELYNPGIVATDAFIFGGGEYPEPIVSVGPFLLNSRAEIAQAYDDYFQGRYGDLTFVNTTIC